MQREKKRGKRFGHDSGFEEVPTFAEFMKIQERIGGALRLKVDTFTEENTSLFIKPCINEIVEI